jgi:hypothetical protein
MPAANSSAARHKVHLVGSIPLRDAAEVFQTVSTTIGDHVEAMPDGETGERKHWLGWLKPVFAAHPGLEESGEAHRIHPTAYQHARFRLRPGVDGKVLEFDDLPVGTVALESYRAFAALKAAGTVPRHCRFQVAIAPPLAVTTAWSADECRDDLEAAYERALLRDVERIAAVVPHDEMAIQWDIASPVFLFLERGEPTRYGATVDAMMDAFVARAIRLANAVPRAASLMFHLCYGDSNHRHSIEPRDMSNMVRFANKVTAGSARPIELFHMPVPRDRSDDAYFAPLANLALTSGTGISLGLIHFTDGLDGTARRMQTACRHLREFLVATECGFGRRPPETVPELLRLHAAAAAL